MEYNEEEGEVAMTLLLERAYARIVQLPETEQDRIALKLLEELEHEEHAPRLFRVGSPRLVTRKTRHVR